MMDRLPSPIRVTPNLALLPFPNRKEVPGDYQADGFEIIDLRKHELASDARDRASWLFHFARLIADAQREGKLLLVGDARLLSLLSALTLIAGGHAGASIADRIADLGLVLQGDDRKFIQKLEPVDVQRAEPYTPEKPWPNLTKEKANA